MSSILASKAIIVVLLAMASGSTASLAYYYQGRTADLNSQVADLNNSNNSQNGQIDSLKNQLDNLTRQIVQLQNVDSQLVNEIAQLRAQLANPGLCSSGKTITIGELLDLSSALSTQGVRAKDSSVLAINDINSMLSFTGCNLKFALAVDDYALNNALALTELQSLSASGVQVVVGPLTSGAIQFILSYANANHIVLISPSSTSAVLAIPNDFLFRTSSSDLEQGTADARMLVDRGANAIIIVQRHDSFGDNLASATATRFKALGGQVIDTIQYDVATTDFAPILNVLQTDFNDNVATYGASHIAIDVVAFEEVGQMILQARNNYQSFPWSTLPWFGTDGEVQDSVIANGGPWAPYVAQVKLPSTLYQPVENTKTLELYAKFSTAYPAEVCDTYCTGAYDDVWLAALATLQAGSYDGAKIQAVMLSVASNFYGVTGWMGLLPSGDRLLGTYQIWKVVNQGSPAVPTWVLAGTWDSFTDAITWTSPP